MMADLSKIQPIFKFHLRIPEWRCFQNTVNKNSLLLQPEVIEQGEYRVGSEMQGVFL